MIALRPWALALVAALTLWVMHSQLKTDLSITCRFGTKAETISTLTSVGVTCRIRPRDFEETWSGLTSRMIWSI
jgi:hypothetical protein